MYAELVEEIVYDCMISMIFSKIIYYHDVFAEIAYDIYCDDHIVSGNSIEIYQILVGLTV